MYFHKVRLPVSKPGHAMKSKKDYDRRSNKEAIAAEEDDSHNCCDDCEECWACCGVLRK